MTDAQNTVPKRKAGSAIAKILIIATLVFFAFCQTFPFYLELVRSVQPKHYLPKFGSIELWPVGLSLGNYITAMKEIDLGRGFLNTFIIAGSYVLLSSVVILITGYVLGKMNFRGKNVIFVCLLATMMVPGEVLLAPNFWLMSQLNMVNTRAALIFPGLVNVLGIFMVKQYMNTIPDSLVESAKIDGARNAKIIWRIILPLTLPVIGTYCILTFVGLWNDYLWPMLILAGDRSKWTLQLKLKEFIPSNSVGEYHKTLRSAGLMITLIPVIAIYVIFQKQFVEGISISGIK